jgi:hypothetical protein
MPRKENKHVSDSGFGDSISLGKGMEDSVVPGLETDNLPEMVDQLGLCISTEHEYSNLIHNPERNKCVNYFIQRSYRFPLGSSYEECHAYYLVFDYLLIAMSRDKDGTFKIDRYIKLYGRCREHLHFSYGENRFTVLSKGCDLFLAYKEAVQMELSSILSNVRSRHILHSI